MLSTGYEMYIILIKDTPRRARGTFLFRPLSWGLRLASKQHEPFGFAINNLLLLATPPPTITLWENGHWGMAWRSWVMLNQAVMLVENDLDLKSTNLVLWCKVSAFDRR